MVDAGAPDVQVDSSDGSAVVLPPNVDASLLAPCRAEATLNYLNGRNYPGIDGVHRITSSVGTWSAPFMSESFLEIDVLGDHDYGRVVAWTQPVLGGMRAGETYVCDHKSPLPYLQVELDGGGCGVLPTGTFTVAELVTTSGDEAHAEKVLLFFEMRCGDGGTLTGCVSYGN